MHVLGWRWNTLCLLLLPQAVRVELVWGFWCSACYMWSCGSACAGCHVLCPDWLQDSQTSQGCKADPVPHYLSCAPQWMSAGKTEASIYQQAEDGKTELSLMHFAITNPKWQPPRESTAFIGFLKERVHRDSSVALAQQAVLPENALFSSIQSLQSESEVPRLGGGVRGVLGVLAGCWQTDNLGNFALAWAVSGDANVIDQHYLGLLLCF